MVFERFEPSPDYHFFIKEFWVYENHDQTNQIQKIIPDGFSEIIVHYGDPYRINLGRIWEQQTRILFSNQISKFFHLENTGISGMIGMKLYPHSGYELFGVDMSTFTDRVVSIEELTTDLANLTQLTSSELTTKDRIQVLENWVSDLISKQKKDISKVREATAKIFDSHGMIDVKELSTLLGLSTRQLERLFKKKIGLTVKFFSRIVRFNYIFQLIKNKELSWIQLALTSGFFDQSHFIKNFKEFTGEEPSNYGFDDKTLANFFLKK